MKIRLYTTDACPKCRALKVYLLEKGITFDIRDMSKSMPYLQGYEVWPRDSAAPMMEVFKGKTPDFYDHYDLFDRNGLKKSSVDHIVREEK